MYFDLKFMKFLSCEFINRFYQINWSIYLKKVMSTFVNENEMSTKIHIVFVSSVGLHPTSGNLRQSWEREGVVLYVCAYTLIVCEFWPHLACTQDVWGNKDTHTHGCALGNTSTPTQLPTTHSKDGQVWYSSCYESISDKSIGYNLNVSTCNNNINNMLIFLSPNSFYIIFKELSYFCCSY